MQLILSKDNKSSYRRGASQLLFIMTESLVNCFIFTSGNLCSPDSFIWKQSISQKSNGFVCETIIFLHIGKRGTLIAEQRIYVSGSNAP